MAVRRTKPDRVGDRRRQGGAWWALLWLQLRVQWRYGVLAVVAALALVWTALLAMLPHATAQAAAPWVLLLDTALLGTTVAGALVILEREQGVRAALAVSPARLGQRLAATAGVLAGAVSGSAVPIAVAGRPLGPDALALALLGVCLLVVLTTLLAVALAATQQSILTFMIALPGVLLPLVAPALAHAAGVNHGLLYAVPTVGAVDLIAAGYGQRAAGWGWSAGWLVVACVGAAWLAHRRLRPATAAARPAPPGRGGLRVVLAFLRTDLATLGRDPLVVLLAASPLLLGLALRFGSQPVHAWLLDTHGFDLDPYRPLLLSVAVVLHVPVSFGMVGALLVLDDSDSRALVALRVSPLTLPRYLAYRTGLVTVAAVAALAVVVPLSGLAPAPGRLLPTLVAATLLVPLVLLATLAAAPDKTTGAAVLKLLGLPIYAPVAAWWLGPAASWLLSPLPSWWVLQAQWRSGWYAAGGVLLAAALLVPLARRVSARARA